MIRWYTKLGTKFKNVPKLFDHAAHNGSNYLNGHCFVSIMLCIPVFNNGKNSYLSIPLGYRMWQKKESKLELAVPLILHNFFKSGVAVLIISNVIPLFFITAAIVLSLKELSSFLFSHKVWGQLIM